MCDICLYDMLFASDKGVFIVEIIPIFRWNEFSVQDGLHPDVFVTFIVNKIVFIPSDISSIILINSKF